MPARFSHFPNVFERTALQNLRNGSLKASVIGSPSLVTKLASKGWIEQDGVSTTYRITAAGEAAMRAHMPFYKRPSRKVLAERSKSER